MSTRLIIIILTLLFFSNCDLITDTVSDSRDRYDGEIIYFNSFESPKDTVGWTGYAGIRLYEEAAPEGGNYSLLVSGGCPIPHALYKIGPFQRNAGLVIEGWGRAKDAGGGVSLQTNFFSDEARKYTGFSIDAEDWKFFQSEEIMSVERGDVLYIHINAGGIVPGTVLIDRLTVRVVN